MSPQKFLMHPSVQWLSAWRPGIRSVALDSCGVSLCAVALDPARRRQPYISQRRL